MKRRTVWTGGLAALAVGIGAGAWRSRATDDVAAMLWPLRFERPDGAEIRLATLRGRPLLVNFWATWCPPCVGELPLLDAFARRHVHWQVLGLAVDQVVPVREFLARHPVAFPVGMAGLDGVALSRRFGNAGGGLPFSIVVDSDGAVASRKLGTIAAGDLERWNASVV